jgi:hypothetical protein
MDKILSYDSVRIEVVLYIVKGFRNQLLTIKEGRPTALVVFCV